jgi:general secretion pathway protein L
MVMFERSVLGLDLGSHSLKAVELRVSPRHLAPGQFRVHPRVDLETPIGEHVQRFIGMHGLPTAQVACALPATYLSTRRLEFPFSDTRRLAQAIPFEIEAETPFHIEDIFVDWNLLSSDRSHGSVAATLVQRSHVARLLEALEAGGCDPHVLEAEGLVLANLAPVFGLDGSQLVVDIGHEKTTFCVLQDRRPVLARSIPVAGRAMTEALAAESGLSLEDAEQRKCEAGVLGRGAASGSPGVVAIVDRIAREAIRTLEASESHAGAGPVAREARITLVGGGARLERIDEALARRTGLETQRIRMPGDSPHAQLVEGVDPVLFAPALALALRLSGESTTRMNFRQGPFAYRQDFKAIFDRELRPTAALAAVFVVLLGVSAATSITLQYRRADRHHDAVRALYQEAFPEAGAPPANPVSALGSALRDAQDRADFLGLYNDNRSALQLLAELSRAIPTDLPVRVTEVNIDRNLIRLDVDAEGYEAADRLTSVLSSTPPFEGAKVAGSIKTDRRSGGVSFNVSIPLAEVESGADA